MFWKNKMLLPVSAKVIQQGLLGIIVLPGGGGGGHQETLRWGCALISGGGTLTLSPISDKFMTGIKDIMGLTSMLLTYIL